MTSQAKIKPVAELALSITRVFDAPRALVYRMWTDNAFMQRWSCPEGFTIPSSDADLHVGGTWHAHMRSPQGEDLRLQGVYREIVRNERLVFTHAWLDENGKPGVETLVTVSFADQDGRTRMDFLQTGFDSDASRDGHEDGWNQCMIKLGAVLDVIKVAPNELHVTRLIDAPRDRVFRCFGDPDNIGTWWGPNGFTTTTRKMEFHVGGVWDYTMHGPDGTDYPNYVQYTEIVAPGLIRYDHGSNAQHPDMFKAVITLAEESGKTRVTLKLSFADAKQRDDTVAFGAIEGGWQNLSRLADYLSKYNA